MRWMVAVALAFALAGCSEATSSTPREIVVKSAPQDVRSEDPPVVSTREPGHIFGVVVDAGIRPVPNATVKLPGLNLVHITDRQGVFAFPDLAPTVYHLIVNAKGFSGAETNIEVLPGEEVRVRFVLDALPPPAPRHTTVTYRGYSQVTGSISLYSSTSVPFEFDPAATAYVIEAAMDEYDWGSTTGGTNSFSMYIQDSEYRRYVSQSGPNPFRIVVHDDDLPVGELLTLRFSPQSSPLPEISKEYKIFITAWFNAEPPTGWSFVNGDP
jgi:hypothetical protein